MLRARRDQRGAAPSKRTLGGFHDASDFARGRARCRARRAAAVRVFGRRAARGVVERQQGRAGGRRQHRSGQPRRGHGHHRRSFRLAAKGGGRGQGAVERRRPAAERGGHAGRVDRARVVEPEARSRRSEEARRRQPALGHRPQGQSAGRDRDARARLGAPPPPGPARRAAPPPAPPPAGIGMNRAGNLALVANRGEGTVSVLTISGKTVTAAGKVDFGNKTSGPSSVAFSPDGKTALVTRDGDHKISVLSVEGTKVEDTKRTMTGGIRPYAIEISPKGDVAVVVNQGGGSGDIDTINVIDLKGKAPRIVHTIDVGQIVEAVAFSDDGGFVAVTAQDASNRPPTHPFYNEASLAAVFGVNGTTLTKVAEARIGKWSQGIAWSRDGKTLLAQNMVEKSLSVLAFDGKTLKVTGEIKLSGAPEGLRTAAR